MRHRADRGQGPHVGRARASEQPPITRVRGDRMRRFVLALLLLAGVFVLAPFGAGAAGPSPGGGSSANDEAGVRNCSQGLQICTEVKDGIGVNGAYTGHDEPSLLFYSDQQGSGNSNLYRLKLPSDPHFMPNQAGTGATWNFQLRPAFWFGMAM